jgi:flagellar biosynthesis component FlhA
VIIEFITNRDDFVDSIQSVYGSDQSLTFITIIGIMAGVNILPVIALVNLMLFHVWLYKKGLTTFEYIMEKREKAENIKQKIRDIEEEIRVEEEKLSKRGSVQLSINTTEQIFKRSDRFNYDQKTKGSVAEIVDENSKGSLLPNGKLVAEAESAKDNIFDEDDDSKEAEGHDTEFRNTAASYFKPNISADSHLRKSSD